MTKSKKILSLALAIVMALSVLSMSAFAAKTTPTGSISITADKTSVAAGETVTVTVTATASENYYVGPVSVPLTYDADLLEVTSVTAANIFGAGVTEAVVNTDTAGSIKVVITPDTAGTPLAPNINGTTLTLYTVVFTAKDDANGTDTVAIVNNPKTEANTVGTLYMGSFDGADVRTAEVSEFGQTLVLANASVDITVGAAGGDPELVLTEHGEEIGAVINRNMCLGDGFDGVVMGIDTIEDMEEIADCVTTEYGYIVVNTDESDGNETTGTVIELYNDDDELLESYVFIYFGDLDRDGTITGGDATIVNDYELTYEEDYVNSEYMLFACDVDMDENPTSGDGTILSDWELTYDRDESGFATQAEIAAYYNEAYAD